MPTATVTALHAHAAGDRHEASCSKCNLVKFCLPMGLDQHELEQMDALVARSGPLHEGQYLFRVGDPFKAVYAVRAGSFKTYCVDDEGREHVLGFHFTGELLGLEAIHPERHLCNAVALATAAVCVMPFDELNALAGEIDGLRTRFMKLMSKDLAGASTLAGDFTAEERLAAFLVGLSRRFQHRGYSAREFNLSMSRRDIANYLRLAPETVTRVLTRFEKDDVIVVEGRTVRLLDLLKLHKLAQCMDEMRA